MPSLMLRVRLSAAALDKMHSTGLPIARTHDRSKGVLVRVLIVASCLLAVISLDADHPVTLVDVSVGGLHASDFLLH
jgi:hypothetical protein